MPTRKNLLAAAVALLIGSQAPALAGTLCEVDLGLNPARIAEVKMNPGLADLIASLQPSVVYIEAAVPEKVVARRQPRNETKFSGSGFVLRQEAQTAFVLTNYHVVKGAKRIRVTLSDGNRFEATELAHDQFTDLSLIKFNTASSLVVASLGRSEHLRVGDSAIVIGNPAEHEHTATLGIVSGLGGAARFTSNVPMIQTDAAINRGNSGGPLFDICGKVVGVVTAKMLGAENMGFAIPIDLAQKVVAQLLARGKAEHPFAGIKTQARKQKQVDVLADETVVITKVIAGTAAQQAGFKAGDIIRQIAGDQVRSDADVSRFLAQYSPGDALIVSVERKGQSLEIAFVLGVRPDEEVKRRP